MKLIGAPGRNNLNAIRLALALAVVWSHSFALHFGSERNEWVYRTLNGRYTAGTVAVMGFFAISGFLISQSFERSSSARSYFLKRIRRIYPGYLAAVAICTLLVIPAFATRIEMGFGQAIRSVAYNLILIDYFPPSDAFLANPYPLAVNGSLWSIPFEFACYIFVAVGGIVGLLGRGKALIGTWAATLCFAIAVNRSHVESWIVTRGVDVIHSFLIGMIVYAYRNELPRKRSLLLIALIAPVVGCWVNWNIGTILVAPALAYLIFYVGYSADIKLQRVGHPNDISYGTYLYAFPIQQALQATIGARLSLVMFILCSAALSLAAGVVSWHLVEKRFLGRRANRQALPVAAY